MTVQDVITHLQAVDPDLPVCINDADTSLRMPVAEIRLETAVSGERLLVLNSSGYYTQTFDVLPV